MKITLVNIFTVDIKFHNITEKALLFNGMYSPIFEKKTKQKKTLILSKGQHYD